MSLHSSGPVGGEEGPPPGTVTTMRSLVVEFPFPSWATRASEAIGAGRKVSSGKSEKGTKSEEDDPFLGLTDKEAD